MSTTTEGSGERGGVPLPACTDGDTGFVRTVRNLVEEEGNFVSCDLPRNFDDILGLGLGAAYLAEVVSGEVNLCDLAVLPDVEGTPSTAFQLGNEQ